MLNASADEYQVENDVLGNDQYALVHYKGN